MTPRSWTITLPDDEDYFTIREDQLESLASGGKNMAMEWVFFCGGAALGLLPSAAPVVLAIIDSEPISWFDLALIGLAVELGVYAYAKYREAKATRTNVDNLKTKIKAGQKMRVT